MHQDLEIVEEITQDHHKPYKPTSDGPTFAHVSTLNKDKFTTFIRNVFNACIERQPT